MKPSTDDLLDYILARLREGPRLAQDQIQRNGKKFRHRSAFFKLKKHADNFLDANNENRFIIMPGLRGVGKTTLLFQIYDYLTNEKGIEQGRVLYISADHMSEYLGGKIIDAADVFISEVHQKTPVTLDEELFILIDEAQYDKEWSNAGKILYDQSKKIFMIFTGSSALSLELNVDAARRSKKESIFPMNFSEYLLLKHDIYAPKGTSASIRKLIFTGEIEDACKKENELMRKMLKLTMPLEKEWENYLCCGGFPFGIHLDNHDIHEKTFDMLDRVIEKDVSLIRSFRSETRSSIFRILMFLALQKAGETSEGKLANDIGISSALVKDILSILEKTHLIFHIKPYSGSARTSVRKAWKYYFLSPSIKTSINFQLGKYNPKKREFLGELTENMVASYFFRLKETMNMPHGIFYSPEKEGVDFLLSDITGKIIPIEVGVGNKDKRQIKKAINKYNSKYGIVVSNKTKRITLEDDVIHIPLTTFSFI
ncbi:MAG: ATP-binding protein [Methanobacterium sp.]|nr:ATP-binding protein [Methanobacterium sp.]